LLLAKGTRIDTEKQERLRLVIEVEPESATVAIIHVQMEITLKDTLPSDLDDMRKKYTALGYTVEHEQTSEESKLILS